MSAGRGSPTAVISSSSRRKGPPRWNCEKGPAHNAQNVRQHIPMTQGFSDCKAGRETGVSIGGAWTPPTVIVLTFGTLCFTLLRAQRRLTPFVRFLRLKGRFRYVVSRAERRCFARNSVWALNLAPAFPRGALTRCPQLCMGI